MSLKKLSKSNFVYIAFRMTDRLELNHFRREVYHLLKNDMRNIIIDLSQEKSISKAEMTLLVNACKELRGSSRELKVMVPAAVYAQLRTKNVVKANNIEFYQDHAALFTDMRQ